MPINFPAPLTQTPLNTFSPTSTPASTVNGTTYVWNGNVWRVSGADAFVTITGSTMTGDLTVPSLNGGQLAGFRNQIINGDFRVWQRGDSFANGASQYTSDRWYTGTNNGSVVKVSGAASAVPDAPTGFFNSLQIAPNAGALWVGQPVELPGNGGPGQFAIGTTWTASFWGRALSATSTVNLATYFASGAGGLGVVPASIQNSSDFTLTTAWQKFEWTFTVNASPDSTNTLFNLIIESTTAANACRFAGVQLEPGPVATPFEHRPVGLELSLCQRYFVKHDFGTKSTQKSVAYSTGSFSQQMPFLYYFPVEMRAQPTADFSGLIVATGVTTRNPSLTLGITPTMRYIGADNLPTNTNGYLSVGGVLLLNAEL